MLLQIGNIEGFISVYKVCVLQRFNNSSLHVQYLRKSHHTNHSNAAHVNHNKAQTRRLKLYKDNLPTLNYFRHPVYA